MPLELFDSMESEFYYVLCLWIAWQLHEVHGSFCHCCDGGIEDWICCVVKFPVKITRVNASAFHSSSPTLFRVLIPCSAGCSSSFILILRGVCSQIVLRDLIWSFIGIMLTGRALMVPIIMET